MSEGTRHVFLGKHFDAIEIDGVKIEEMIYGQEMKNVSVEVRKLEEATSGGGSYETGVLEIRTT